MHQTQMTNIKKLKIKKDNCCKILGKCGLMPYCSWHNEVTGYIFEYEFLNSQMFVSLKKYCPNMLPWSLLITMHDEKKI